MGWVYRYVAVSCFYIKFGYEGFSIKFGDYTDYLIDSNIMKGKFVWINFIVDICFIWGGKVYNEALFFWLVFFRNNFKVVNMKIRVGGSIERISYFI